MSKQLGATLVGALAVETIGAVDPFGDAPTYLPPPRQYFATWVLWFVLGLISTAGERAARLAWQLSALVLLTMMVVGPFGNRLLAFLTSSSRFFSTDQGGAA